jgi:YggT family protein
VGTERTYSEVGSRQVEQVRETYVDQYGNVVQSEQRSYDDAYEKRRSLLNRIAAVISFIVGLITLLVGTRFLLLLFAANPANDFVDFIYDISHPFVEPFEGIFDNEVFDEDNVIEWASLIAMVVWSVVGAIVVRLMYVLFSPSRSSKRVYSTTRENMP